MKSITLLLNTTESVKSFVNIISRFDYDMDLRCGRYVVDAKSIMGIFSLNLSKPIKVEAHCGDQRDKFLEEVKSFIVD